MRHSSPYSLPLACLLGLLVALTACAAPSATPGAPGPALPEQSPSPGRSQGDGAPPIAAAPEASELARPASGSGAVELDYRCSSDDDCAVKNVGNCCGYYPACVNRESPTDPAAVQAQCAEEGRMGVCGFPAISSCQCVEGRCESGSQMLPAL